MLIRTDSYQINVLCIIQMMIEIREHFCNGHSIGHKVRIAY